MYALKHGQQLRVTKISYCVFLKKGINRGFTDQRGFQLQKNTKGENIQN